MGPTWGPLGSCRPQVGPMLASWTFLCGTLHPDVTRGFSQRYILIRQRQWDIINRTGIGSPVAPDPCVARMAINNPFPTKLKLVLQLLLVPGQGDHGYANSSESHMLHPDFKGRVRKSPRVVRWPNGFHSTHKTLGIGCRVDISIAYWPGSHRMQSSFQTRWRLSNQHKKYSQFIDWQTRERRAFYWWRNYYGINPWPPVFTTCLCITLINSFRNDTTDKLGRSIILVGGCCIPWRLYASIKKSLSILLSFLPNHHSTEW